MAREHLEGRDKRKRRKMVPGKNDFEEQQERQARSRSALAMAVGIIIVVGVFIYVSLAQDANENTPSYGDARDMLDNGHVLLGVYWLCIFAYLVNTIVTHSPNWGFRMIVVFNTALVVDMVLRFQLFGQSLGRLFE